MINWSRTIMELLIFYGIIGILLGGVGASIKANDELAVVSGTLPADYGSETMDMESYHDLLKSSMEEAGIEIDKLRQGEFGLSDKIDVLHVWHSEKKLDTLTETTEYNMLDPDWWEKIIGDIKRFFTGERKYGGWSKNHRTNLSAGEDVYIYPHFTIDREGFDPYQRYIVVQAWDVGGNRWFQDIWEWQPWHGRTANIVARLYLGKMPKRDLFYCIDFARCDTDVTDYFHYEKLKEQGRADIVERYGGVIYGDESTEPLWGAYMAPHEISRAPSGGLDTFFDIIGNIAIGWAVFQSYGVVSLILNTIIFGPISIIILYVVYTEVKSILPFIGS